MCKVSEDIKYYTKESQRNALLSLISNEVIEKSFFLTGGTALSVFYLHHRISNDLDLFTIAPVDLSNIDFMLKTESGGKYLKIKESSNFLSALIEDTKVDFVIDPLSNKEERNRIQFENSHSLMIDNIGNIISNKLCAIVSRSEPKDFIDFYFLSTAVQKFNFDDVYKNAGLKDAIFDDPPTAAFQIEENLSFIKNNPEIIPKILIEFNAENFFNFYNQLVWSIYKKFQL